MYTIFAFSQAASDAGKAASSSFQVFVATMRPVLFRYTEYARLLVGDVPMGTRALGAWNRRLFYKTKAVLASSNKISVCFLWLKDRNGGKDTEEQLSSRRPP